jgi:hypothetical protein
LKAIRRPHAGLTLLLALLVVPLLAAPASAHGAQGKMTLIRAEQIGPLHAVVEVGLLYANDSEMAEAAVVTASFSGPDGRKVGPVPAPRVAGARYVAEADLPAVGPWAVTVASEEPAASVNGTVEIVERAPTTTAPPAAVAVPTTAASATMAPASPQAATSDSGEGSPVVLVLVVIIVLAAGVAAVLWWRSRSAGSADGDGGTTN